MDDEMRELTKKYAHMFHLWYEFRDDLVRLRIMRGMTKEDLADVLEWELKRVEQIESGYVWYFEVGDLMQYLVALDAEWTLGVVSNHE